ERMEEGDLSRLVAAICEAIAEQHELVPYAVALLPPGTIPKTSSGKIQRHACRAGFLAKDLEVLLEWRGAGDMEQRAFVAPRTPVEEALAGLWEEVLGIARVHVFDHFFELGGHSLLAMQVAARVRSTFGVDVPLRVLFETSSVAGFAQHIEAAL